MQTITLPSGTIVLAAHVEDVLEPFVPEREHNRTYWARLQQEMRDEPSEENTQWRGGVRGVAGLVQRLQQGWPEGTETVRHMVEALSDRLPPPRSRRRARTYGMDGEWDCDRWANGRTDDPCVRTERHVALGTNTVLSVVSAWGASGSMTAREMYWSGACMVTLALLFDAAGLGCDLSLIDVAEYWGEENRRAVTLLRLRDAGEPLDVDTLTILAAHVGAFRTIGLGLRCMVPWNVPQGLGYAADAAPHIPALVDAHLLRPAPVIVPRLHSADAARSFLLTAISDFEQANRAALEGR